MVVEVTASPMVHTPARSMDAYLLPDPGPHVNGQPGRRFPAALVAGGACAGAPTKEGRHGRAATGGEATAQAALLIDVGRSGSSVQPSGGLVWPVGLSFLLVTKATKGLL